MKPFYQQGGIEIYTGECSQVLAQFPGLHFDLTVTSPPYDALREYKGYTFDFDAISGQLWRVTGQGGVVVWVVADQTKDGSESGTSFRQALGFMELGFRLKTMVWDKEETNHPNAKFYPDSFEYMFVLSRGKIRTFNPIQDRKNKTFGRMRVGTERNSDGSTRKSKTKPIKEYGYRQSVWHVTPEKRPIRSAHPAIFPEALARDHIISWSNPGDLVLDPMAGSGTVGKMALELGRRCVLIDISEEYCKIMVERLRQPSFFSIREPAPKPQSHQVDLEEMIDRGLE